jgi:hypothetical protein
MSKSPRLNCALGPDRQRKVPSIWTVEDHFSARDRLPRLTATANGGQHGAKTVKTSPVTDDGSSWLSMPNQNG